MIPQSHLLDVKRGKSFKTALKKQSSSFTKNEIIIDLSQDPQQKD